MKLLNVDSNTKTIKGQKQGYLTGILYLAPYTLGGRENVCPNATIGCKKACLYSAGKGAFSNVQQSRINKTQFFFDHKESFLEQLVKEIEALERKAKRLNLTPVIRLNGTSDIDWENIKFSWFGGIISDRKGIKIKENSQLNIFQLFDHIQFYDYTKDLKRARKLKISNYHLTYSYSEDTSKVSMAHLLASKRNISMIFKSALPTIYRGYKVINGDTNDLRFLDESGVIVGLSAKGKAKKDTSGFTIA